MAKSKKVLSLALAVVMAISMLSIGAFAAKTTPTATVTISTSDKTEELQTGDTVTVTVAATASEDYFVGPTSVPVTYDPALFAVSNVTANTELFGAGTTEVATNTDEAGKVTVVITPLTAGDPVATNLNGQNVTLYTFTLTATAASGKCDVAVLNDQKTTDNLTGELYITSFDSADAKTAELTNVGQTINGLDTAKIPLSIGSAVQPADLAVKAEYASSGIIIDTAKKFEGKYDGVVYGFTLDATVNAAFYTNRLEATNGGSITMVKTPYQLRPKYGTGATVQVKNAEGKLEKTYVIVIFGDVDGDGSIQTTDITPVLNHCNKDYITDELKVMAANARTAKGRSPQAKADSIHTIDTNAITPILNAVNKIQLDQAAIAASHASLNYYYQ